MPNPEWKQVPRGSAKATLMEKGLYVDAFQLDKNWDEARLYNELFSLFEKVLKSEGSREIGYSFAPDDNETDEDEEGEDEILNSEQSDVEDDNSSQTTNRDICELITEVQSWCRFVSPHV